jgi:hypothetical protein
MAFTGNYTCDVFKTGLMNGDYDFSADTFKIALYTNAATLNAGTTAYTADGETSGGSYVAGGQTLVVSQTPTFGGSGNTVYISFSNASWTGSINARGALIYKSGGGNPAVCVLDFGSTKSSNGSFVVEFPPATNTSAIIRLT